MTLALRITLILVSILTFFFVLRKIRSAKVRVEDSIFWLCVAALILLVSIFPEIFYALSNLVGTYSPANFVFLFFIFILLVQSFSLSMRVSQSDTRIKELTQQLAIEKFERYKNDNTLAGEQEAAHLQQTQGFKALRGLAPQVPSVDEEERQ